MSNHRIIDRGNAGGFTLIELMIALALAGLVVGGALQLHASFNKHAERQNEIGELQQTLRVSMLIIERAIRAAGAGLSGGKLVEPKSGSGCSGGAVTHYGFQWSNKNAFADPISVQSLTSYIDTDPDYFMITLADSSPALLADGDSGANLQIHNTNPAPNLANYYPGDLFAVLYPPGAQCHSGSSTVLCSTLMGGATSCIREISAGAAHGGSGGTKFLQHNPAQSNRCFNPTPSADSCTNNIASMTSGYATVRHLSASSTIYRIMPPGDPLNPTGAAAPASPKLTMRTAPWGTALLDNTYGWTVIAENIDDMQIALIMQNGDVCTVVDDPAVCDPTQAFAVRVTLQARSSSPLAGLGVQTAAGAEDETPPASTASDGYLRRALTAEIELRNLGANP
jgi:prepilin-type N-terminal cleavage/methylation domain-containing protein